MDQATKDTIVAMLEELPNITAVRKLLGVKRTTFYSAKEADPEFAKAVNAAKEDGYDMMEAEAHSRAVNGWQEPVWYQGEEVGEVRRYSDSLLKFLLTHCKPKKFNPGVKVSLGDGETVKFVFNVGGTDNG